MALTVLQILPALSVGGVETGTLDLSRSLIAKGHRAIVISSGGPLVEPLQAAGAIHYNLPVREKNPWTIWQSARRVAEIVESHGVDVIHARSRVPAWVGFLAWRIAVSRVSFRLGGRERVPVFVTTAHGYYSVHPGSMVMGWGRQTIAISEAIARHMIDRFGVPAERIRLIPRGVELARFSWKEPRREAPHKEWRIATIGRVTPIKGHRDLIRAFSIVAKNFPKAKLLIVGKASPDHEKYFQELVKLVEQLKLTPQVEFTGHEPDVAQLLSSLDLIVLPSVGQEAFGRVLIEAGASGVPVVATRVGGMSEVVVEGKTGLLVAPQDPMGLAAAMTRLLKNRELAVSFSKEARKRVTALYPLGRMVEQTLTVYEETTASLKILVIKLSATGDIVLITPSLRALRKRFPKAHIGVVVGREGRELLHRSPYVDELIVFDRKKDGTLWGLLRFSKKIRDSHIDLVVDFQNNRVSHWLGFLSGAPQRYGYAGRRWSRLLTHQAAQPKLPLSAVDEQMRLLQLLGVEGTLGHLELWPGPLDEKRADALLRSGWVAETQPLVVVHPGGAPEWLSKRWPTERYAQLIDRLAVSARARVVITGTEREHALAEEITRHTQIKPIVAAGLTSLNELAALIGRAQVFVSGDTAPLHVAAAVGTPLVALFGSTDPARHLPPAPRLKLLKKNLPCSPCYKRVCYRRGAGYMECMKTVSVDEVAQAVMELLQK